MRFDKNSWVILNPVEQNIKVKIEAKGTPLKDSDISIYRGIITGFNEAFIITDEKRQELIAHDPKSAEIIRPILRGRDIKRYEYEFANLYLIATFPSRCYDIDHFPAIKEHLESFGKDDEAHLQEYGKDCWGKKRLEQTGTRGARKRTNNKWFETQDSIGYWDDFSKQKIVWSDIAAEPSFVFVKEHLFFNNTCYMMTNITLGILGILNSKIMKWYFPKITTDLGDTGARYFKQFVELLPIPKRDEKTEKTYSKIEQYIESREYDKIDKIIYEFYDLTAEEREFIENR